MPGAVLSITSRKGRCKYYLAGLLKDPDNGGSFWLQKQPLHLGEHILTHVGRIELISDVRIKFDPQQLTNLGFGPNDFYLRFSGVLCSSFFSTKVRVSSTSLFRARTTVHHLALVTSSDQS